MAVNGDNTRPGSAETGGAGVLGQWVSGLSTVLSPVVDNEVATLGASDGLHDSGLATVPGDHGTLPADCSDGPDDIHIPAEGESVGHFLVRGRLGAGAAGVVLLAFDPELDRQVAIKLLSPSGKGLTAQARLIREARSAAGLQHPNVVAVFQVGTHAGQVYVVMEYVDGGTLREWVTAQARDWPATLQAYRQAGLGLAAAHAAGLVHRDFKPDNVLIDSTGRVRVSDFGLVGHAGDSTGGSAEITAREPASDVSLTRTGAIMGTPAYMSPEQMAGGEIDATADQFAFCVALYEALWGRRPFVGDSLPNLVAAVYAGADAPPRSTVPARVQEAVMRGLSLAPDDRYANMTELLRALEPARTRGRTALVLWGVGLLAAGGLGASVLLDARSKAERLPPLDGCDASAVAWNPSTRSAVQAGFSASGHAWSDAAFDRVAAVLDTRSAQWTDAVTKMCAAAPDQGGGRTVETRACLQRVQVEIARFTDALSEAHPAIVDGAVLRVHNLPTAAECFDATRQQPPADPVNAAPLGLARSVRRLELTLAGARSAVAFGRAGTVLPQLREAGDARLLARALLVRGTAGMGIGRPPGLADDLREAMTLAASRSAHGLEAEATATLMSVLMADRPGVEAAAALLPGAEAAAQRSGDLRSQAIVALAASNLLSKQGKQAEALARTNALISTVEGSGARTNLPLVLQHRAWQRIASGQVDEGTADLDRALLIVAETVGQMHPNYGTTLYHAASVHFANGDYATAVKGFERAEASLEASLGPGARMTIGAGVQRGRATLNGGDTEAARAIYQQALARCELATGCDERLLGVVLENLAWTDLVGRHYDDAVEHYRGALSALLRNPGDHAAIRSRVERYLGYTRDAAGDHATARVHFEAMRAAEVAAHGPKHEYVIWATNLAANSARYGGDCKTARKGYRRALALREDLEMSPGPYLAEIMLGLGECELAGGQIEAARESLTTAYGLRESNLEPDILGGILFAHARLLALDGRQADAVDIATQARHRLANAGVPRDAALARVDAWLTASGRRRD